MASPTDYIAYYKLQTDATDETGNYDGVNNGATFANNVAVFNGSSHIAIPSLPESATYSISLWLAEDTHPSIVTCAFSCADAFTNIYTKTFLGDFITLYSSGNNPSTLSTTTPSDLRHIGVTTDGVTAKIYLNGVLYDSFAFVQNFMSGIGAIGSNYDGLSAFLDGSMRFLRLYDYTLTPTNMLDIYNEEVVSDSTTATITVNATASVIQYIPKTTATIKLTSTARAIPNTPVANAQISASATATVYATLPTSSIFTFAYSIQQSLPESRFKFAYSIEQPITSRIIRRVNT